MRCVVVLWSSSVQGPHGDLHANQCFNSFMNRNGDASDFN